ncbi:MAG: hypothetical protein ACREQA_01100 [Candidatus Binatia bacterium]
MQLRQLRYSRAHRKVDRDALIRKLKRDLDTNNPIRDEALLVGGLLDVLLARYCGTDRELKRYERRYFELASGLVQTLYEEARTKARRTLPPEFYNGDQGLLNGLLLIRYVIEQRARWKLDDTLPKKATARWFNRVHLGTLFNRKFGNSPIRAMQTAYPTRFFDPKHSTKPHLWHPWDFAYRAMWQGRAGHELAKHAVRHVIEAHEGWKLDETLRQKASEDWFCKVGLSGMLQLKFRDCPFFALQAAYPDHFFNPKDPTKPHLWHPWDFVHRAMWQGRAGDELAKHAIRHLIEVHEGWKLDESLPQKVTDDWFRKVRLQGMLTSKKSFNSSPWAVIRFTYPEQFWDPVRPEKPHLWHDWDFHHKRMWQGRAGDELVKQAIRHLIEVHEGWPVDQTLRQKATAAWFKRVGLGGVLSMKLRNAPGAALRFAYPKHCFDPTQPTNPHLWHPWDFRYHRMWWGRAGDELARQAVRHLIEVHEGWKLDETLPKRVTRAWFKKAKLEGMLANKFGGSPQAALRLAYREHLFDPMHPTKRHAWHEWEFHYRPGMWQGKAGAALARQAIHHLIEVHEGWPVDRTLRKRATKAWFHGVGLYGMLQQKFQNSTREALRFACPDLYGPKGRWPLGAMPRKFKRAQRSVKGVAKGGKVVYDRQLTREVDRGMK